MSLSKLNPVFRPPLSANCGGQGRGSASVSLTLGDPSKVGRGMRTVPRTESVKGSALRQSRPQTRLPARRSADQGRSIQLAVDWPPGYRPDHCLPRSAMSGATTRKKKEKEKEKIAAVQNVNGTNQKRKRQCGRKFLAASQEV